MAKRLLRKIEFFVVDVARREETVKSDVVAMRAVPAAFEVTIELGANDVEPVPPFATATVPLRFASERQLLAMEKHPVEIFSPTFDVVVAWPEMLSPRTVVVPKPVPEISNAEIDVVANVVGDDVER